MAKVEFQTVEINETGRANLIKWLEGALKRPELAEPWADGLIENMDGSDPEAAQTVEVRSWDTEKGYTQIYPFRKDEFQLINWDEDGNVVGA